MQEQNNNVRRFEAASMAAVLAQVRAELGQDALILEQEKVAGRIIVTAALEMPDDLGSPREDNVSVAQTQVAQEGHCETDRNVTGTHEPAGEAPLQPGVTAALAQEVRLSKKPIRDLKGCLRFCGSSGVGKTSLLIKLLVEWVMHNGINHVAVVSTDDQKLAGSESLQLACQLLGVELLDVPVARLADARAQLRRYELVLVDTPALETCQLEAVPGVTDVLVISAQHANFSLSAQLRSFEQQLSLSPERLCALTHVDQPFDEIALKTWLVDQALSLGWLGTSAYLPEGIEVPTDQKISRFAARSSGVAELA